MIPVSTRFSRYYGHGFICQLAFSARFMHPMHFIQIQTTANYYTCKYFLLFGCCAMEQCPFPGCPVRWPELIQVNHLLTKPYHATNPEKMFLSAFNCLRLFTYLNTILLFIPYYRKFPEYSDTQKICCNHSKIWTLWLYQRVTSPNDADGMANSVDSDQTAPDLGLHCLPRSVCPKT